MHLRHYRAALEVVNAERRAMGLSLLDRLPDGKPGDPRQCTLARAIPGAYVQVDSLASFTGGNPSLLADLRGFVYSFDTEAPPGSTCDPATLVEGGIEEARETLVPALDPSH